MKMLQSSTVLFSVLPLLLFCSLFLFSPAEAVDSAYTLPSEYFINCGSKSSVTFGSRSFIRDTYSGPKGNKAVIDTKPSADKPRLYQTARVFQKPCLYELIIRQSGTYMVRFHFFAFLTSVSLADAVFDVSVQPDPNASAPLLLLLSNFSMKNSTETTMVKEFLLTIRAGKFKIYFIPSQIPSGLAFVNAIEVFLAPTGFIPNYSIHINSSGIKGNYSGLLSNVLQKVYRINVGGSKVKEETDTLMRNWIQDDQFLLFPGSARNRRIYSYDQLEYEYGANGSTKYIAPDDVYGSAKELISNNNSRQAKSSNITWRFKVNEKVKHFVRAHFCDFISPSLYSVFSLCFNGNFCRSISPYETVDKLDAPFYADFVVDSAKSGNLDISVVPQIESTDQTAFLNGLEIMQVMENSFSSFVPLPPKPKKKSSPVLAASLGLAFAFIMMVIVLIRLVCMKKKDQRKIPRFRSSLALHGGSSVDDPSSTARTAGLIVCLELRIPFAEIQQATQDFDSSLFVGEGGSGKVYSGTLRGEKVAVKRMKQGQRQGLEEFRREIMVLSRITRHRNLVSLIGYSDERSEMILVYEFMAKGNLRDNLYDTNGCSKQNGLSWEERLEICIGTARALSYLHTGSAVKIIHRDVKSTNILLDENYTAKISDFGISKSNYSDLGPDNTSVKGTVGYLDPEYLMSSELTDKSDVYSFGAVLLEILCARPAVVISNGREEVNLAEWGMLWMRKGQLDKIIDPMIVDTINPSSLRTFAEITEKCLKPSGSERPVMGDVLWYLEYALQLQLSTTNRDPLEDSTTNASSEFPMPFVRRLPSNSFPGVDEEDAIVVFDDASRILTASEVFSTLRIGDAR